MTRLVIVESPTKAKTIRGFLPKDYRVEACMGHVRDLPESATDIPAEHKGKDWARLGVNTDRNFEPLYVVPAKKRKVVKELKDALSDANELILATDEDREGESIGWHLVQVLRPKVPVRRMVFHEITRDAIQDALANPRAIDEQLVRAQETRRILDRLVGYTVSPLLWKKIAPGLSAGRVQSVAVRLLVNREVERLVFRPGVYWDLRALLLRPNDNKSAAFEAFLQSVGGLRVASSKDFDPETGKIARGKKVLLLDEAAAAALRDRLAKSEWRVLDVAEKSQLRKPPPPFTTSTLQQEANRKLRLSSRQTMQIAQKLYEQGLITYMRTDSVHLSSEAIGAARRAVEARYGKDYLSPSPRQYATKSKGAQEAHEAIRPAGTQMRDAGQLGLTGVEATLYDMIWKRTLATQMADAQLTLITANIGAADAVFQANGRRIDFPGYFRVYVEGSDDPEAALDDREVRLPLLRAGEPLDLRELTALRHETQPPTRYTEATLVQTLEREGIGRPSTYAAIISTIQDRGYVTKQSNQLVPTFTAFAVNRLLERNFPELVDLGFTARMEQSLDDIAEGKVAWLPYLETFYRGDDGLESQVREKEQSIDPREVHALALDEIKARVRIGRYGPYLEQQNGGEPRRVSLPPEMPPAELDPATALKLLQKKEEGPDQIGVHPQTGEPIYLLEGRFGPYVQLGEGANGEKPRRASLLRGMKPKDVTLDVALALLSLPRRLGAHTETGADVIASVGRFGPYVQHGSEFRSLATGDDVLTIGLPRALELLSQPKGSRSRKPAEPLRILGKHPETGEEVALMSGPYGLFVKHTDINAGLPKSANPEALTLDEAVNLLKTRGKKAGSGKGRRGAKSAKTSATASKASPGPAKKSVGKATTKKTPSTTKKSAGSKTAPRKTPTR